MRLLGFDITRSKTDKALSSINENRGGWLRILESYAGAWQRNVTVDHNTVLSYSAVYACMTLISSDIAKLRVKLVQQDSDGIWSETSNPAYSPVLRKPNTIQNRIQFWEFWMLSKLSRGNVYVLKQRDNRGVVVRLHILDPLRVTPLVSDSGDVFYRLQADNIAGVDSNIVVPAREIIHDRMNCIFHPLVGTSPIFAAGVAATQGLNIQSSSAWFFGNKSQPGGILTAPGAIGDATAARLKESWETNFTGENAGRIAVVGDGLKYEALAVSAHDSQLIEQLKWTAEVVCSVFHVPPYKIGVGGLPSYNNVQSLNVEYYSQCLQMHIESAELALDEGLEMEDGWGTEFDLDGLLRMDSVTQMDVLDKAKNILTLDERRKKLDRKPIEGGATVYLQQQDHSVEAIAARDRLSIAKADNAGGSAGDVQADALNGAQITALQGLVVAASIGEIPLGTLRAVIAAAFPTLTDDDIEEIVAPIAALVAEGGADPDEEMPEDEVEEDQPTELFISEFEVKAQERFAAYV